MKTKSKIASFFFGTKTPIDLQKFNYKELKLYKWNKLVGSITSLIYFILYNSFCIYGWYSLSQLHPNAITSTTTYIPMAIGHAGINAFHFVIHKFSLGKTKKDVVNNGNPVPKTSVLGIFFLVLAVVPALIWLTGRTVLFFKFKKYLKANGNYFTEEQIYQRELINRKNDKNIVTEVAGQLMNEFLEKKGE